MAITSPAFARPFADFIATRERLRYDVRRLGVVDWCDTRQLTFRHPLSNPLRYARSPTACARPLREPVELYLTADGTLLNDAFRGDERRAEKSANVRWRGA